MADKTIKINPDDMNRIKDLLSQLSGKQAAIAMTRSINRALTGIRTDTTKEIRKELNVKAGTVRDTFTLSKASYSSISGKIRSKGRPLNVVDSETGKLRFSGKYKGPVDDPSQGEFSFIFKKSKGKKSFPGAFRIKFKTGHEGVFIRKKSASGGKRSSGLKELWTTRVPDIMENKDASKMIMEMAGYRLVKRLESQVDLLLRG